MIHLYTGDGKGKTTAAIGQLVRMTGYGEEVLFCQFMKGRDCGEVNCLRKLSNVTVLRSNRDFGFYRSMTEKDKQELTDLHNAFLKELLTAAEEKRVALMVLDEITYPVTYGLIDLELLKQLLALAKRTDRPELVLTGRNAPDFLLQAADYVTEMKAVKHPFEKGISARKGIEF